MKITKEEYDLEMAKFENISPAARRYAAKFPKAGSLPLMFWTRARRRSLTRCAKWRSSAGRR
jgi:hypothetical protein